MLYFDQETIAGVNSFPSQPGYQAVASTSAGSALELVLVVPFATSLATPLLGGFNPQKGAASAKGMEEAAKANGTKPLIDIEHRMSKNISLKIEVQDWKAIKVRELGS